MEPNRKSQFKKIPVWLVILLSAVVAGWGYRLGDSSKLDISGTSTLHDWESSAENFSASMNLAGSEDLASISQGETYITEGKVTVKVKALKSGKKSMNNKMHEALKEESHPEITFVLEKLDLKNGEKGLLTGKGKLTIAGVSKTININPTVKVENGAIIVSGSEKVLMTDYGVKPPKMMMGTIRTGDEVTISYSLEFEK